MSRSLVLMLCVLIAVLGLACARHDTNRNANTNAAVTASADQIGVPECDNFLNSYENCVTTKVPDAARAQFQTTDDNLARRVEETGCRSTDQSPTGHCL